MTDKVQKIREEVERIQLYTQSEVLKQVLDYIDKVQEEPVSKEIGDYDHKAVMESLHPELKEKSVSEDLNTESMIESYRQRLISQANGVKNSPLISMCLVSYKHGINETLDTLKLSNIERTVKNWKEPACEDLENAAIKYAQDKYMPVQTSQAFKSGAKWKKENLWKPADGDNLPEIDREVIVLVKYNAQRNIHDEEYPTYKVGFGHRPNPDGWDGKNIDTNVVTHYTPKLYDKGGWNAPDIAYWLDVELPKEIEL